MERTAGTFAQIGRSLVFAVASALTLTVFASEPEPPPTAGLIPVTQCAIERASVRSRDPEDAKSMCAGAGAAIQFFQSHGVSLDESVRIVIGEELPSGISSLAVGCFSRSDRISYVLSYEKFVARKYWLGLQVSRQLYETVASHEVAHAIASCASASTSLTTEATEYLAFVTMFETMDPQTAREALSAYPGEVIESVWDINEVVYGLNPIRFGVMAYRHYLKQIDRSAFVREILSGTVLGPRYFY